ncbi:MAG: formylglycine-generating enzyme family protein [Chitinispirillales bacterium]|jgi:formylglycine-generating enzyme required for sulfatase activity|nr:formylglycine-generating enzyme family protein [Chitinispirillales bacterium]
MISNFFVKISAALIIICANACAQTEIQIVRIPGGTFIRGSNDGEDDERPVRAITVSGFSMMVKEVTEMQYKKCVDAGKCPATHYRDGKCLQWTGREFRGVVVPKEFRGPNLPVVCVTWQHARAYCASVGMKLPTEAQWEYAALGGAQSSRFSWGNSVPDKSRCAMGAPHQVALFAPNGYGLYDMTGNVWEWTADFYDRDSYSYPQDTDPKGPESALYRTIRGGGWYSGVSELRIQNRHWFSPNFAETSLGFRCVR